MSERYKYPNDSVTQLIADRDNKIVNNAVNDTNEREQYTMTPQNFIDTITRNERVSEVLDKTHSNTRNEVEEAMKMGLTKDEAVRLIDMQNSGPVARNVLEKMTKFAADTATKKTLDTLLEKKVITPDSVLRSLLEDDD